jgi:exodeoxyribonuclease-3
MIAAYVPSLNLHNAQRRPAFLARLKSWLESIHQVGTHTIVIGDLNVLEPNHIPRVPAFESEQPFAYGLFSEIGLVDAFRYASPLSCEHSWYDRNGFGQRLDHALVSCSLIDRVAACGYVHETRGLKLSDHSGLLLRLESLGVARVAGP